MPYLRVANVFDGWIDYSDIVKMNFAPAEQEIFGLLPGDILLNEGQSLELVGRSAIYDGSAGKYCFQNTLVRFRCFQNSIPEFCQAVFKYWLDTRRFTLVAKQTTSVAHLGADRFAKMPFARPEKSEQERIASCLATASARIEAEQLRRAKLHFLKRGLAHDLLTGRVRVKV
jgi:type I restriction enzyme S subunit